ncbi:hypothetical protein H4582DRAFT_1952273 [Lactarius indigo]|nr:hypothetical protein H4582DRAFT_1952273 [Lactarius indigo]
MLITDWTSPEKPSMWLLGPVVPWFHHIYNTTTLATRGSVRNISQTGFSSDLDPTLSYRSSTFFWGMASRLTTFVASFGTAEQLQDPRWAPGPVARQPVSAFHFHALSASCTTLFRSVHILPCSVFSFTFMVDPGIPLGGGHSSLSYLPTYTSAHASFGSLLLNFFHLCI